MRIVAQLVGTLLLVGFVRKYWWFIALVVAAVAACKCAPEVWARHQAAVAAQRRRVAALAARADQQHQWVLAGDLRGTYGATFAGEGSQTAAQRERPLALNTVGPSSFGGPSARHFPAV